MTTASTTSSTGSASGESSTGVSCVDVEPVDNPELYNCSLADQDCPSCHKCTHGWDGDNDTFPLSTGTVCVPVSSNPVVDGEPCVYGVNPGEDDCGFGSFCWSPDETTTDGYCVALCEGGDSNPTCDEGFSCVQSSKGSLGCLPSCDPFDPSCPDESESCLFDIFFGEPLCHADGGFPSEPGAECFGVCGEGLACVGAEAFGPGCEFDACCTNLCDADHPCADPEQACLGECGEPPEGLSRCVAPAPPDPLQCPPEDAEPNYPWCSETAGCDEGFGGGNDCVSLCFCDVGCDAPADCPTPATGNPTVECTSEDICMLSCANGETCPNGMYCDDELFPGYCMWFVEEEPGCTEA